MPSSTPLLNGTLTHPWIAAEPPVLPRGRLPKATTPDPSALRRERKPPKPLSTQEWARGVTPSTPQPPSPVFVAKLLNTVEQPGGAGRILNEILRSQPPPFSSSTAQLPPPSPVAMRSTPGGGANRGNNNSNKDVIGFSSQLLTRLPPPTAIDVQPSNMGQQVQSRLNAAATARAHYFSALEAFESVQREPPTFGRPLPAIGAPNPSAIRETGIYSAVVRRPPTSPAMQERHESQLGIKRRDMDMAATFERPTAASATVLAEVLVQRAMAFENDLSIQALASEMNGSLLPITHVESDPSRATFNNTPLPPALSAARRLKLALASLIFHQLDAAQVLPPVLSFVRAELMNAVYLHHDVPTSVSNTTAPTADEINNGGVFPRFYDMETYQDALQATLQRSRLPRAAMVAQMHRLELKVAAEQRGMKRLSDRTVLGCHFRAWRQCVRSKPVRLAEQFLGMATKANDRTLTSRYFQKWINWLDMRLDTSTTADAAAVNTSVLIPTVESAATVTPQDKLLMAASVAKTLRRGQRRRQSSSVNPATTALVDNAQVDLLKTQIATLQTSLRHLAPQSLAHAIISPMVLARIAANVALPDDYDETSDQKRLSTSSGPLTQSILRDRALDAGDDAIQQSKDAFAAMERMRGEEDAKNQRGLDTPFAFLEKISIVEMLLIWTNALLDVGGYSTAHQLRAVSLDMSFADGKLFVAICANLFPEHGAESFMHLEPPTRRIDRVLDLLHTIGIITITDFVTSVDIASGGLGSQLLLVHLWRTWFKQNQNEMNDPEFLSAASTVASEAIASTRLLYTFANAMRLTRLLAPGMDILYARVVEWIDAQLMAKVRSSGSGDSNLMDLNDFTTVTTSYFGEIENLINDCHTEVHKVALVLKNHYPSLKKIFDFYKAATASTAAANAAQLKAKADARTPPSGSPLNHGLPHEGASSSTTHTPQVANVSAKEMIRFLEDTRLMHKPNVSKEKIMQLLDTLLLRQLRREEADDDVATAIYKRECSAGSNALSGGLPHQSLYITKTLFVEIIVRVASMTLVGTGRNIESGVLSQTLENLFNQDILPRAMSSAKSEFKKLVADPRVQDVINSPTISKFLAQVYRHYATLDPLTGKPTMTSDQFVAMLIELQLVDKQMKKSTVVSIFTDVQDDEVGGDEVGATMSLSEFGEAVIAIAMFKNPHPLQSVHRRLTSFLETTMMPICKSHLNLKRGGVKDDHAGGSTTSSKYQSQPVAKRR